jgi:hypothetical protein
LRTRTEMADFSLEKVTRSAIHTTNFVRRMYDALHGPSISAGCQSAFVHRVVVHASDKSCRTHSNSQRSLWLNSAVTDLPTKSGHRLYRLQLRDSTRGHLHAVVLTLHDGHVGRRHAVLSRSWTAYWVELQHMRKLIKNTRRRGRSTGKQV